MATSQPAPTGHSPPSMSASPAAPSPPEEDLPQRLFRWWHVPLWCSRQVLRLLVIAYFLIGIVFLLLRYVAAPQIEAHREDIAGELGRRLGMQVQMDDLDARWDGLRPRLRISQLRLVNAEQRTVLELPEITAEIAWTSLWRRRLELHELVIAGADLDISREADGRFVVAGIPIEKKEGDQGSAFSDFLLSQHHIVIRDAQVDWTDHKRKAPTLTLDKLSLRLDNDGDRHRFAITAQPPADHSGPLDIRGDLRGDTLTDASGWRGTVYLALQRTDMAAWTPWLDYPVELPQGQGAVRAWLNFEGLRVGALTTDLALQNVQVRFEPRLPMLHLTELRGRLKLAAREGSFAIAGERVTLATADGLRIPATNFAARAEAAREEQKGQAREPARGEFSASRLDVRVLAQLSARLPLPASWQEQLATLEPRGWVERLESSWQGELPRPDTWKLSARLTGLALTSTGQVPGMQGISAEIDGNEKEGSFRLEARDGALDMPTVFRDPLVELQAAQVRGNWRHAGDTLSIKVDRAQLRNADIDAEARGEWTQRTGEAGRIDMTASAKRGDAKAVWRYIPAVLTHTGAWLEMALLDGHATEVDMHLRGDPKALANHALSEAEMRKRVDFRVGGRIHNGRLHYANNWPELDRIDGSFLFEGRRMLINAQSARYRDVTLSGVQARIDDLHDPLHDVVIRGKAGGPSQDFLSYISSSPLDTHLGGFARNVTAAGNGNLDLQLRIPLYANPPPAQVTGEFRFDRNQVRLMPGLPPFTEAAGSLRFSERSISALEAAAVFAGGRVKASGASEEGGLLRVALSGNLPTTGIRQLLNLPVGDYLNGEAAVQGSVTARSGTLDLQLASNLVGISSTLPAPLTKKANEALPFRFGWHHEPDTTEAQASRDTWSISAENVFDAQWTEQCKGRECTLASGGAAAFEKAAQPAQGFGLSGRFEHLDLDAWRTVAARLAGSEQSGRGDASKLAGINLQARSVVAGGHLFRNVTAHLQPQGARWRIQLSGPDVAGQIDWSSANEGRVQARLDTLTLTSATTSSTGSATASASIPAAAEPPPDRQDSLPELDVTAQNFTLYGHPLGRLEMQASNQGNNWQLSHILLSNEDARMEGSGSYRRGAQGAQTQLEFRVDSSNVGGLLTRFGFPDSVNRGEAKLNGKLGWRGLPTRLHYPTLTGDMELQVRNGQFVKLNPGAGRLLGILSLQSLPRRATLDFSDIFSQGFAFDAINGHVNVRQGVLHTDDLVIRGPAAKVSMRGNTDLAREQHDLRINVQPTLSEGVAVGAAAVGVVNPVLGVATYLAQKLLSDPVEKLFAYDYSITGNWAEPRVVRLGLASLPPALQSAPAGVPTQSPPPSPTQSPLQSSPRSSVPERTP